MKTCENGFEPSIAQAIEEMKAEQGKNFSLERINLAELERRTGVSRAKLRRLKANNFQVKPHASKGKHPKATVLNGYFSRRVHDDIDAIMADIKEAHKTRSESAPDTSVIDELKRDMDEAASFKGSRLEQLIFLFCKQTKIRYNKLTEEEKQWLVRIAQKSELAKGGASQRGKRKK